ncbi:MAG TPA: hypothetical protein VMI32_20515, partial [Candidatus Solibacter sp.]|nr:hypothetical protein [Candidatus Solibacter sp.]
HPKLDETILILLVGVPLVLSPHGELRKWYALLVPLLQAERSGESKAPPAKAAAVSTYHAAASNFHLLTQTVAGCPGSLIPDFSSPPE